MKILNEFKAFAMRGNVVDMAVGVIIGGAFGAIVTSLVNDVIMPPIGILLGGVDFSDLAITLKKATDTSSAVVLSYGKFIQTIINFLIIAWAVFMLVKAVSGLHKKKEEAPAVPAPPTKEETLLTEIRDLLKEKK